MGRSARDRLLKLRIGTGRELEYVLLRYAFERFLYRLGRSPDSDRFILKGAAAFCLWMGPMFRVTRDTDLECRGRPDHGAVRDCFRSVCNLPVEDDGVVFDADSVATEDIKKEDKYKGIRVELVARVEQARLKLQFDIGFGDSVYPAAEYTDYPTLLDGPAPRIKIYPRYTVVAEKFSAVAELGMPNSRLKDYFDLWALAGRFDFDFKTLRTACERTFERNGLSVPEQFPVGLTTEFSTDSVKVSQWNGFLRRTQPAERPVSLEEAVERIRAFLAPVVFRRKAGIWTAAKLSWEQTS